MTISQLSFDVYWNAVAPTLQKREQDVLNNIPFSGGLTTYEVAEKMGVMPNCISGRFAPLEKKGFIKSVGKKQVSKSGKANVWIRIK